MRLNLALRWPLVSDQEAIVFQQYAEILEWEHWPSYIPGVPVQNTYRLENLEGPY